MPIADDYKAIANAAKRLKRPVVCPTNGGISDCPFLPGCPFLFVDGCPECPLSSYEDDLREVAGDMARRYSR